MDYKKFGLRYRERLAELRATPEFEDYSNKWLSFELELDRLREAEPYNFEPVIKIQFEKMHLVDYLMKKFHLPPPFRHLLENPFNPDANGLSFAPYRIDPQTIPVEKGEFKNPRIAGGPLDELTVTIYGKLSTEDWKTLKERIEELQKIAFSQEALRPFRQSKNIDEKVRIVKEMASRKRRRVREEIVKGSYVDRVDKAKNGKLSVSEKRKLIRLNPQSVEHIVEGKDSADVATQVGKQSKGNDKGAAVRQTLSRHKRAGKRAGTS